MYSPEPSHYWSAFSQYSLDSLLQAFIYTNTFSLHWNSYQHLLSLHAFMYTSHSVLLLHTLMYAGRTVTSEPWNLTLNTINQSWDKKIGLKPNSQELSVASTMRCGICTLPETRQLNKESMTVLRSIRNKRSKSIECPKIYLSEGPLYPFFFLILGVTTLVNYFSLKLNHVSVIHKQVSPTQHMTLGTSTSVLKKHSISHQCCTHRVMQIPVPTYNKNWPN